MLERLFAYQVTGAQWLADRRTALLADEMGLGKTATTVCACDLVEAKTVAIVCPAIATMTWAREFARWQQANRTIQLIRSSADAGQGVWGDVVVTSYNLLDRILPVLRRIRFDVLILDEGQALKSITAARTRAVYGKGGLVGCTKRVWLLTGTPMPNGPHEIWPHYYVLFAGALNYPTFVERYCLTRQTQFGLQIIGANTATAPELAAFLGPHVLQRKQVDVLSDLPPLRWGTIPVAPASVPPMPEISAEVAAILGKLERNETISVVEQMALAELRRWTGIAKAPSVVELIKTELEGGIDKIVVFAYHREVIRIIGASLGAAGASISGPTTASERQRLIDKFQHDDTPRVLVIQILTGGTAITLHRASHVIFAETTWVPADALQAAKRCHRIGQTRSVLSSVVSLSGSIDERVDRVVARKAAEMTALESLIREGNAA